MCIRDRVVVDHDVVQASNINSQAIDLHNTISSNNANQKLGVAPIVRA